MLIYWLLICIILILSPLAVKKQINRAQYIFYYAAVSIFMIIIIGMRKVTIGIDTLAYYNSYISYSNIQSGYLKSKEITEYGYGFIQIVFNKVGINFQGFLIISAAFYICSVSALIFKYSKNPAFSYLLFIGFGYFTFAMSSIRQTIAISFILLAFIMAAEKKPVKFILAVLAACIFHITALVYLPVYFIFRLKLNKKTLLILVCFGVLIYTFKNPIRSMLNLYAGYSAIKTGGNLMYLFLIGTVIVGTLFIKPKNENFDDNSCFFYMLVSAAILFPITQFNPAVMRLNFYFSIFMIIYIPNMLSQIKDKLAKFIGYFAYSLTGLYFMVTQVFALQNKLLPYVFFWK